MNQRAYVAVISCALIAGFGGVFVKGFTIPATSIAWFRTAIPALILGGWMLVKGISFFRGNWKLMLGASVLNTIRMYLYFVAYIYTSIGNAVLIFYSWPIFATIYSSFFLKEKISKQQIGILLLAFLGIIVAYSNQTFSFGNKDFVGMAAAIFSAAIYAMTVILFKKETNNFHRNEIIFYQNFTGLIFYFPFFFFVNELPTAADWTLGIVYANLIGIIGFGLFFYGLKYLKASVASALMYIEVVSAIILSYVWMGDQLSWNMIIGGGIILVSSFFINRI